MRPGVTLREQGVPGSLDPDRREGQCAEQDSNLRRRTPADLQSAPFGHLGIRAAGSGEYTRPAEGRQQSCRFLAAASENVD